MGKKKNRSKIGRRKTVHKIGIAQQSKIIKKKKPTNENHEVSKKTKQKNKNNEKNQLDLSSLCNDKNVIDVELIVKNTLLGPGGNDIENLKEVKKLVGNMTQGHVDVVYFIPADKDKAADAKKKRLLCDRTKLRNKYGVKAVDKMKRIENQLDGNEEVDINMEDAPAPDPNLKFKDFDLSNQLKEAIKELKYKEPTLIQKVVIPLGLEGRDILACAKTGTGKTAAYLIPIIERLLHAPNSTRYSRVLIVLPTRELAIQVYQSGVSLAKYTKISIGMAVGGLKILNQDAELEKKPDIIVATPGRLIASMLLNEKFTLSDIEILVVDEADRMLDKSFKDQLKEVVTKLDENCQIFLLSATMTEAVKDLAMVSLKDPIRAFVSNNTEVATTLKQEFTRVKKEEHRLPALIHLLKNVDHCKKHTLIFVPLKTQCTALYVLLKMAGLNVVELHGDQSQKERMSSLNGFKSGVNDILIATDVASRGLEIPGIQTVINLFIPPILETYIHRAGRAGRAGNIGFCVSLFSCSEVEREQYRIIKRESVLSVYHRDVANAPLQAGIILVEKLLPYVREAFEEITKKRAKYLAILDKRYKDKQTDQFNILSKSMSNVKKKGKDFYCSLIADEVYKKKNNIKRTDKRYEKKLQRGALKANKLESIER